MRKLARLPLPSLAFGAAFAVALGAGLAMGLAGSGCSASDPGEVDCTGALPIPGMARAADCSGPLVVYATDAGQPTTVMIEPDATSGDDTDQDAASGDDASAGDATTMMSTLPEFTGDTFDPGEQPGNQSTNTNHNFDGGQDPFRQNCQTCHAAGSGTAASSVPWAIGGSIVKGVNGSVPYDAAVEVRVIGADGGVYAGTYSDTNANFWVELTGSPPIPAGAKVAIRSAAGSMEMADPLTSGSCNATGGCHGTSPVPGPIYLP